MNSITAISSASVKYAFSYTVSVPWLDLKSAKDCFITIFWILLQLMLHGFTVTNFCELYLCLQHCGISTNIDVNILHEKKGKWQIVGLFILNIFFLIYLKASSIQSMNSQTKAFGTETSSSVRSNASSKNIWAVKIKVVYIINQSKSYC